MMSTTQPSVVSHNLLREWLVCQANLCEVLSLLIVCDAISCNTCDGLQHLSLYNAWKLVPKRFPQHAKHAVICPSQLGKKTSFLMSNSCNTS
eukprot:867186-Amphidinium_carterae.1